MKRMVCWVILVVGLGLAIPGVGRADTNHPHSVQGDSTKSMKAFKKQQKKQKKQFKKTEKNAQKDAKKRAASHAQPGH